MFFFFFLMASQLCNYRRWSRSIQGFSRLVWTHGLSRLLSQGLSLSLSRAQLSLGLSRCLWANWGVARSASASTLQSWGRPDGPSKPLSVYVCTALASGSSWCLSSKKKPDKLTAPTWPAPALCIFFYKAVGFLTRVTSNSSGTENGVLNVGTFSYFHFSCWPLSWSGTSEKVKHVSKLDLKPLCVFWRSHSLSLLKS